MKMKKILIILSMIGFGVVSAQAAEQVKTVQAAEQAKQDPANRVAVSNIPNTLVKLTAAQASARPASQLTGVYQAPQ